jgi:predicted RNA-binding protein
MDYAAALASLHQQAQARRDEYAGRALALREAVRNGTLREYVAGERERRRKILDEYRKRTDRSK